MEDSTFVEIIKLLKNTLGRLFTLFVNYERISNSEIISNITTRANSKIFINDVKSKILKTNKDILLSNTEDQMIEWMKP